MEAEEVVQEAVRISEVADYISYRFIGHGEINDTYAVELKDRTIVLRIAKYADETSLKKEHSALKLMSIENVPKLVFFDDTQKIDNRLWIMESFISGKTNLRLTNQEFFELGRLLAKVHSTKYKAVTRLDLWEHLLECSESFGDEKYFFNHPDSRLRKLVIKAKVYITSNQSLVDGVTLSLIHSDATPSNILVDGDKVSLIDWEFAIYSDPMRDFSTIYYEDIEYNEGKWRIKISNPEKAALFKGYVDAGGQLVEERIAFWMNFDKLGAALFLYWRVHESGRPASEKDTAQYKYDLEQLITSLERFMVA